MKPHAIVIGFGIDIHVAFDIHADCEMVIMSGAARLHQWCPVPSGLDNAILLRALSNRWSKSTGEWQVHQEAFQ